MLAKAVQAQEIPKARLDFVVDSNFLIADIDGRRVALRQVRDAYFRILKQATVLLFEELMFGIEVTKSSALREEPNNNLPNFSAIPVDADVQFMEKFRRSKIFGIFFLIIMALGGEV